MFDIPSRIRDIFNRKSIIRPILITSSRDPSQRTRTFINELSSVLPDSIKITRGKLSLEDLNYIILKYNMEKLIIIGEFKGNPGRIEIYNPIKNYDKPEKSYEFIINSVALRKELGINDKIRLKNIFVKQLSGYNEKELKYVKLFAEIFKIPFSNDNLKNNEAYFLIKSDLPVLDVLVFNNEGKNIGPNFRLKIKGDVI
nr:hypothetical protein [Caldisphaera sp.]